MSLRRGILGSRLLGCDQACGASILKDPELNARNEAMTPLRKLAEPADIAAAIAFLAGPAAAMITGHTLAVDGGFLAQ